MRRQSLYSCKRAEGVQNLLQIGISETIFPGVLILSGLRPDSTHQVILVQCEWGRA
jgi:hypothetical protein